MQPEKIVMHLHHLSGTRCIVTFTNKGKGVLRADLSIRDPHGITPREAEFHKSNLLGWVTDAVEDPPKLQTPLPGWSWKA